YWEDAWRVRINDSYFVNGAAAFGGGMCWYGIGAEVAISNCIIYNNTADHGGGLYWSNGAARITGCDIRRNTSEGRFISLTGERIYGGGGGIFCWLSDATIEHSVISRNVTAGSGGGVYLGGGAGSPLLRNCLLTENSAILEGGGVASYWSVTPTISNCTIADNIAHDPKNDAHGRGGGLSCSYESDTTLIDSILWGNIGSHGNQIALGSDSNPDLIQRPAKLTVSYCDIEGGIAAVSNEYGRILNWGDPNDPGSVPIETDPLFVTGPFGGYYLSQIAPAGHQAITSPAVNAGSDLASKLGLDTFTTGTKGTADENDVDMGYHYRSRSTSPQYKLTVSVVGGQGTIEVKEPQPLDEPADGVYTYYAGTVVTITATPEAGWRVVTWSGANDGSRANTTVVFMNSDKDVAVEFEQTRTLDVPGDYTDIWLAVADTNDGDTVVIAPGTYSFQPDDHPYDDVITIDGKAITITSANPEDPCTVAATVIDGRFVISNVGRDTVINGFTITNSQLVEWWMADPPSGAGNDGIPGLAKEGGGMDLVINASPTILNCVFDGCYVWGSHGSNGNNGTDSRGSPGNGGWAGPGHGGAVVCRENNRPLFRNCTFINCWARGGDAGNAGNNPGGHGGNWEEEQYNGRSWIWDYGPFLPYWKYTGMGGAVYCYPFSSPEFENCTFANNRTYGGSCGISGQPHLLQSQWPLSHYKIDSFGGAVYAAEDSFPSFTDCLFVNNEADVQGPTSHDKDAQIPINYDPYISYGGAIAYEDGALLTLIDCTFNDNLASVGGAIWATWADTKIGDCNFIDNTGFHGGGVYLGGGTVEITGSDFRLNVAVRDTSAADPNTAGLVLGEGGAIHFFDIDAMVSDCNITDNQAGGAGGGIWLAESSTTIIDCNLSDNESYHGGALYSMESTGAIKSSTFTGNRASLDSGDPNSTAIIDPNTLFSQGGGYACWSSTIDITDSVFTGNYAGGSGGAIFYSGSDLPQPFAPRLHNSLLAANTAGRDGGAISANRYAEPTISNCTISDNTVTGNMGPGPGYGGGLYCSHESNVKVIDSIIWGNVGPEGSQIAVDIGFQHEPKPSSLTISYSDIGPQYDPNQLDIFDSAAESDSHLQGTGEGNKLASGREIYSKFNAGQEKVDVIITLVDPAEIRAATNWDSQQSVSVLRAEIADRQSAVLSSFAVDEFSLKYRYENLSAISGEVTADGLDKLLDDPKVAHIEPVRRVYPMLAQSLPLANALEVRQSYDGTGIAIAIADSGVDYTHPMLGGGGFPNTKVIGGYDTAMNDRDPMPVVEPHGTACAGIAAGSLGVFGDYIGGVAPNAKIYALKIGTDAGALTTNAALAAWDWCITHRNDDPANPIKAISNSWGIYSLPFDDPVVADAFSPAFTHAADTAVGLGITILASSGNDGFPGWGISWPSAISKVISVGAVFDTTDLVTGYSNTGDMLDILAPADPMYTLDIVGPAGYTAGDYFPFFGGTSSSCPFAAGAVACIQQAALDKLDRYLTPAEVRSLLIKTGDPVTDDKFDPVIGMPIDITKPRVNLGQAIASPAGPPIYIAKDCTLNDWQAPDSNSYWAWDDVAWNRNVIGEDPNFILGYYLSQFAAGQITESNCVDGGSDLAGVIGLDTYTTRIDGVNDVNIVDMGYHYRQGVPKYQLTVTVLGDPNDSGIHGAVEPNAGSYYGGTELTLTAKPDPGYYLKGWYDVNDVLISVAKELDVVMDSNQIFRVRFRLPSKIEVSGGGDAIHDAVTTAENGDTLVVGAGTYNGDINFRGKELKLVSTNPDDPNIVAGTIINCQSSGRAFVFDSGEDAGTIVNGLTIVNGSLLAQHGGAMYIGSGSSPSIINVVISDCNVAVANGGAIFVDANSSPTFTNVTISNCTTFSTSYPGGNGGGVYIDVNCSPTFTDCTITDCFADGLGGGLYCSSNSSIVFVGCEFGDNEASFSGGGIYHASDSSSTLSDCVFTGNTADISGGGIYYNIGCSSEVTDCSFTDNSASGVVRTRFTDPNDPNALIAITTDDSPLGKGGGIHCNVGSSITVTSSSFASNSANSGGGLYLDPNCLGEVTHTMLVYNDANEDGGAIYVTDSIGMSVADCNIAYNAAARGGGLFFVDSPESTIVRCSIKYNEAVRVITTFEYFLADPNDPNALPVPILPIDPAFDPNDPNLIVVQNQDRSGIGQGGGIYSFAGPTLIADCQITHNMANTSGGGIYAAGGEYHLTTIRNCLLTNNSAGRDGGAISTNWQNELSIANCTIADNTLTGIVSYGGGLYGSYDSNTTVRDSIIWDNMGRRGSQIALGSGDPAHPLPSELKISHSNIDLRTTRAEVTIGIDPDRLPVIRPGFDQFTLAANDDLSTNVVNIGFNANYFGVTSSTLYVNNNGNVTFDRPLWTFTPFGLTTNIGTPIIAPFFADVDTRSGNVVTYGTGTVDGHRAFGVNWIDVGYFYMNTDKLNTFQLVLIERSDRAPGDFDIEFNYGTINWETGDASMGQGGLGGSSARAGFSNGTGNPGTFYEIPGSGINGAFLDISPMGLVHNSRNSTVLGRYIFRVTLGTLDITTVSAGAPIYVENGSTIEGWDPIDPNNPLDPNGPDRPWNVNTYNIADDPNFVTGPSGDYYLSQIAAGYLQLVDSNCVDAGSDLASVLGMDEYTTRIDLVADANTVDMGYHYPLTGTEYGLTVIVVGPGTVAVEPNVLDPNDAAYDPNNNVYTYRYYANSVLRLTATPEEGYRVGSWSGTDNVPAWNTNSNFVTLDDNKVVRVEFEQIITHNILVPEEYATIEEAVAAAGHGDTRIIVNEGVHRVSDANGIDFQGRYITLMSTDPNDPDVVANTIIDCNGTRYTPYRAFHFHSGEDANTIV
ncbi:MAG: right-handed parallel beta-helix repeat-containing protein, partial [Phycisphaerales bacterium]